jgi:hypothetical protein
LTKGSTLGIPLKDFTDFTPKKIKLREADDSDSEGVCDSCTFKPGTASALEKLLNQRYRSYTEVSFSLWLVVNQLSLLRNAYPSATLHACEDGGGQDPVRLDNTVLGNYPLRPLPPDTSQ